MKTRPVVSVIIPVFQDTERLKTCLHALSKQTYPRGKFEVIVVDNEPSAEVEKLLQAHKNTRYATELRRGANFARNRGVDLACGEIIAFTDSDCIPDANWLENGVAHLQGNPKCGLVGGRIRMVPQNEARPRHVELYDCALYLDQHKHVVHQRFAATANAFIPKKVLQEVGKISEHMFPSEDEELGQRIHTAGFALTYAPDTCVSHPALQTFGQLWRRTMRNMRGKVQYYRAQGVTSFSQFSWRARHFVRMHALHDWRCLRRQATMSRPVRTAVLFGLWFMLHVACVFRGFQLYCAPRLQRS